MTLKEHDSVVAKVEELEKTNQELETRVTEQEAQLKRWMGKEKKWNKKKKQLKKEASKAIEQAQIEKDHAQQCTYNFNMAVLSRILENVKAPADQGIWVDQAQLKLILTNVIELIK